MESLIRALSLAPDIFGVTAEGFMLRFKGGQCIGIEIAEGSLSELRDICSFRQRRGTSGAHPAVDDDIYAVT